MPLGLPEMGKLSHVGQGRERGRDPWAPRTTWNFKHDCELAVFLGRGSEPSPGSPEPLQPHKHGEAGAALAGGTPSAPASWRELGCPHLPVNTSPSSHVRLNFGGDPGAEQGLERGLHAWGALHGQALGAHSPAPGCWEGAWDAPRQASCGDPGLPQSPHSPGGEQPQGCAGKPGSGTSGVCSRPPARPTLPAPGSTAGPVLESGASPGHLPGPQPSLPASRVARGQQQM